MSVFGGILTGIGGIASLLGSLGLGNKKQSYDQLNPYASQTYGQFQDLLGQSDSKFQGLSSSAEGSANKLDGIQGAFGQLMESMRATRAPGVNEGFNLFQGRREGIMEDGRTMAEMFTQPYRERGEEVARRRADQAAQAAMANYGGAGFSGAAAGASSAAAADVLSNYELGIADRYGSIGSAYADNMMDVERGLSENAPQMQFQNLINSLLNQGSLNQSRGATIGSQAQLLSGLASEQGARSRQLLGGLGALSAPQYAEPMYTSPLSNAGAGFEAAGNMFSNPEFLNLFK